MLGTGFILLLLRDSHAIAMQEETNEVKVKPGYKELGNHDNVTDLAQEAWDDAYSRCHGFVGDLFTGQLQSTVQCPGCGCRNHSFENFKELSVAISKGLGSTWTVQVGQPSCCCHYRRVQHLLHLRLKVSICIAGLW